MSIDKRVSLWDWLIFRNLKGLWTFSSWTSCRLLIKEWMSSIYFSHLVLFAIERLFNVDLRGTSLGDLCWLKRISAALDFRLASRTVLSHTYYKMLPVHVALMSFINLQILGKLLLVNSEEPWVASVPGHPSLPPTFSFLNLSFWRYWCIWGELLVWKWWSLPFLLRSSQ